MDIDNTTFYVLVGIAVGLLSLAGVFRHVAVPSIIDQQQRTLEQQHIRMDKMQAEMDELRETMRYDQTELSQLRLLIMEWQEGMRRVFAQMRAADLTPVWTPSEPPPPVERNRNSALARRMVSGFSRSELDDLAYNIGIVPDEIPGTTRDERVRELIELASRRGIMPALIGEVNRLRPKG